MNHCPHAHQTQLYNKAKWCDDCGALNTGFAGWFLPRAEKRRRKAHAQRLSHAHAGRREGLLEAEDIVCAAIRCGASVSDICSAVRLRLGMDDGTLASHMRSALHRELARASGDDAQEAERLVDAFREWMGRKTAEDGEDA